MVKRSVILLLLAWYLGACLAVTLTNFTDESALLTFKAHITTDPSSILSNWSQGTSFCNWVGVSCSQRHQRVTSIQLPNMGLYGTIPKQIGNLSFLVSFNISRNSFYGHLPNELGLLRRLKSIDFGWNNFNGTIPNEISDLVNLEVLSLPLNNLSGTIPFEIFNISSLRQIALTNNSLSGTLPENMCNNLPKLEELLISMNQLSGEIPTSLEKCTELLFISFSINKFTGSVPAGIGSLSKLQGLLIGSNILTGDLPQSIFNISSLVRLDLPNNVFTGYLPNDICYRNPGLQVISVAYNQFSGNLPSSLPNCKELQILSLTANNFTGRIPSELGSLSKLQGLYLGTNSLTGTIPSSLSNLSMLEVLGIAANDIHGNIPVELGLLSNLKSFSFHSTNLEGEIPHSIFNISTLERISGADNHFSGTLPTDIGFQLPNLLFLYIGGSGLGGTIPSSISNASNLIGLDLSENSFTGQVPMSLGNLVYLENLKLGSNNLTNDPSTPEISFLTALTNCRNLKTLIIAPNPLNGIFPKSVGNFSLSLENFQAMGGGIKGTIPSEFGKLRNLVALVVAQNDLTGTIPETIGDLLNLQYLQLFGNKLEGSIPESLCNLKSLSESDLSENKLSGSIPSCIGNLTSVKNLFLNLNALTSEVPLTLWSLKDILVVNLSSNFLSGHLPPEIGDVKAITQLELSRNNFSGDIPSTIGQLQNLLSLSLSMNRIDGNIPSTVGDMVSLESLDLSQNNLSGEIPKSLETLSHLKYLNVSSNELTGEIPSRGPFTNFTADSFMSNDGLCGEPKFQVRVCKSKSFSHRRSRKIIVLLKYILPSIILMVIAIAFVLWLLRSRNKKTRLPIQADSPIGVTHIRISYYEILRATNYFSEDNLIGRGSVGMVYKGMFSDGLVYAVKVFNLERQGAFKSFDAECEVMRNIRHRNLVKIISSCANLDFRALVLEYMPNENLDKWLYSHNYCLDIVQRLSIMIDVASAIEYLHHGYSSPVAHCDLKPSNILLDEDMVARVGDFGIAKLLTEDNSVAQTKTLGTIGYMAPEYGSAGMVSIMGDVYSYGILLMETFTRKKPTDDLFQGELSMKSWVHDSLPSSLMEVVDANLLRREDENFMAKEIICLSTILELALECTAESPEERINMKDVLVRLNKSKSSLMRMKEEVDRSYNLKVK